MPKLSRTLKKALRLRKNKGKYVEVDALLNKKEKQQIAIFISVLIIPCAIGLALFILN